MPVYVKQGGVPVKIRTIYLRSTGIAQVQQYLKVRDAGAVVTVYANRVVATLSASNNVLISSLFSAPDWASGKTKLVIVPSGVTIGSTSPGTAALRSGTGWGGKLRVEVYGSVRGAGGAANGGTGGDAFDAQGPGIELHAAGELLAGGGGGGKAGNGGGGYFTYTVTEGPAYDVWNVNTMRFWRSDAVVWNGTTVYPSPGPALTSVASGGWTYHRGAQFNPEPYLDYYVSRSQPATAYTSGGVAGNAGRGQGSDGAKTNGSGAVSGGTNAGSSGVSGSGGGWGQSGGAGTSGNAGNNGSGTAGQAGGLAGFAIKNIANVTLTGSGNRAGR